MKRILVSLIITTAAVLAAGIAWAAWSAHSAPGTAASAKAPTMPAGPMPTVNVSGANVAVSFSQTSLGSSQVGSLSGGGYLVKRYTSGGTAQTVGTSCNTIVSGTSAMLSCTENAVPDGSWLYGVTPAVGNWRGAEGTRVAATVDTTAPLVAINAVTTPTNNSKPSFSGGYGVASGDNAAVTVTVYRGAGTGGTVVATPTATLDTVAHTWSTAALASALSPDGSYTVAARQTDTAGNTGAATSTFLLDTAPPTVAVSTTTNPVNSTNRTATSASGTTETGATVSVVATDGAGHSSSAVIATVTSTTWSATGIDVSGLNDGTITYTATATDAAGNTATAAKTATKDTVVPTVTVNQASAQADPTKTSPINFTVVFSKSVTGFTASGVTVGGTAGGTKTVSVTGSGTTYNVAVSGMTDGTVTASVVAAAATDADGNPSSASTSADNTVTYDTTRPTVTVNQASAQADPTNASPINFTVVFSEPVTGFTSSGVTLGGTAGGTKTIIVTGSDSTYNVAVSGMTDGTVTASVSAAAASDGAGNANTASTSIDNSVTYDTTPPTASAITTANKTGGTQGKAEAGDTVTMTYNEAMAATSILSGWNGSSTNVVVRITDGNNTNGLNDVLTVWDASNGTQVALGSVDLASKAYVNGDVSFNNSTMSLSSGTITITLGTVSDGTKVGSDTGNNKVKWTPSNAATDLAGNAASTAFKQSGNVEQF